MRDLGSAPSDDGGLLVLVDRLAAAGADPAAARAIERVRGAVEAGTPPAGLRHIADGLTARDEVSLSRSADDAGGVVAAVRDHALLVLDGVVPADVATTVTALVDDGRRVIVTAADEAALDAVRAALPPTARDRVVDALPTLAPADLHRLRVLLATSTPSRRARSTQQLPDPARLPGVAEVAELCAVAVRPAPAGAELIADVLAELDDERRGAVTAVAGCVNRSLSLVAERAEPWTWELLGDLIHGRRRAPVERLVQSTAQALATIEEGRDNPPVRVLGPLPPGAIDTLDSYLMFREAGGRARSYFRAITAAINVPWDIAVGGDLVFPGVQGRRTVKVRLINAYLARLHAAAVHDADLAGAFVRVTGLVAPPQSLLRPGVALRVLRGSLAPATAARGRLQHRDGLRPARACPAIRGSRGASGCGRGGAAWRGSWTRSGGCARGSHRTRGRPPPGSGGGRR